MSEPQNPYLELNCFRTQERELRTCDHPDCARAGEYRAPRSPDRLREYYWFCLEHVREYNAAWNYFANMSEVEIERYRRADPAWHRPTWPLNGGNTSQHADPAFTNLRMGDPFDILSAMHARTAHSGHPGRPDSPPDDRSRAALEQLGLDESASKDDIRRAYRRLAKRYHPDTNGGDASAADRFKAIVDAYRHLLANWPVR